MIEGAVVRTLNPVAYAIRREAFVDAALRLIASRGYDQLSILDVIAELGASKGAFYHYFDSKGALLAAVVERMVETATGTLDPIVADAHLSALQKLEGIFARIAQWKREQPELQPTMVHELMRVWFSDDNAIVREQLRRSTATRLRPLFAAIVRQGAADGSFSVSSSEGAANVLVSLSQGLNETASELFVERQANAISFEDVRNRLAAYTQAFERILGIPAGSWPSLDDTALRVWFS